MFDLTLPLIGALIGAVYVAVSLYGRWRRQRRSRTQIAKLAARRGWSFSERDTGGLAGLPVGYLSLSWNTVRNVAYAPATRVWMFEQSVRAGRSTVLLTGALTTMPGDCPRLTIGRRDAQPSLPVPSHIETESVDFNELFAASGDEILAFSFLDGEMMELLLSERAFVTEISVNRNYLVVYTRSLESYRWPRLEDFIVRVRDGVPNAVSAFYGVAQGER